MNAIMKCWKYDRKSSPFPLFSVMMIMQAVVLIFISFVNYQSSLRNNERGVFIVYLPLIFNIAFMLKRVIPQSLLLESRLRRYYLCTYRPLTVTTKVLVCWLLFIIPFALLQKNAGAELMYISSMCLGASLAVTVFSAAETINSFAGPVMQVIVLLFEFPAFIWLMTSLMLFPKNFRDGIASVTCNANLVFAASVLLLILSVAFNHIYPRLAYRKFTAFTLRK